MSKQSLSFRRSSAATHPPQPYSPQTLNKHSRLTGAIRTDSICPYCAVGCSLNVYTKAGEIIDIEGNPDVVDGCQRREQMIGLKHEPDIIAPEFCKLFRFPASRGMTVNANRAA